MMNRIIAQVADLEWGKVLMFGLVLTAGYYFLSYDGGEQLDARIKAANEQLEVANQKLAQTKKAMAEANRFEQEVKRLDQQFVQINEYMPSSIGPAELTQIVNQSSGLAGVRVSKIEPKGPDTNGGFYEASRVQVSLQGNYTQILKFLEMISRVPKLLTFDMVSVSGPKPTGIATSEAPPLLFEGMLVGYRYIKDAPYVEPKKENSPKVPGVPGVPKGGEG